MNRIPLSIPDLVLLEPKVFQDNRGAFFEFYRKNQFRDFGIDVDFVQDNHSSSVNGVLRGLHYQIENAQDKLIRVVQGEVYDVAVDLRAGSPWFGQYCGVVLSQENRRVFYIPKGFAHGFYVKSPHVEFMYKCSDYYSPVGERGIVWNDPGVAIDWPIPPGATPILSEKDMVLKPLSQVEPRDLPVYNAK